MGRSDTTNAVSRTTITIMEVTMSWDELYKELQPKIPFDVAKTIRNICEETGESETFVRAVLERKVEKEGWNKERYKGTAFYWPPS